MLIMWWCHCSSYLSGIYSVLVLGLIDLMHWVEVVPVRALCLLLLLLGFFPFCFLNIYLFCLKILREGEPDRDLPSAALLPKWAQLLELNQSKARSFFRSPVWVQGTKGLSHLLCYPRPWTQSIIWSGQPGLELASVWDADAVGGLAWYATMPVLLLYLYTGKVNLIPVEVHITILCPLI